MANVIQQIIEGMEQFHREIESIKQHLVVIVKAKQNENEALLQLLTKQAEHNVQLESRLKDLEQFAMEHLLFGDKPNGKRRSRRSRNKL